MEIVNPLKSKAPTTPPSLPITQPPEAPMDPTSPITLQMTEGESHPHAAQPSQDLKKSARTTMKAKIRPRPSWEVGRHSRSGIRSGEPFR